MFTWRVGGQELWDIYGKFVFTLKGGSRHTSNERAKGNMVTTNKVISLQSASVISLVYLLRPWWWSIFCSWVVVPCDALHLRVMYPGADVAYLDSSRGGQDDEVRSLPARSQLPLDLIFQAFLEDRGWHTRCCNCFSTKIRALSGPVKTEMPAKG